MCEIDYILSELKEPPEGLYDWCRKKCRPEFLVYKTAYYYEPLEDRRVKGVECKCTRLRREHIFGICKEKRQNRIYTPCNK